MRRQREAQSRGPAIGKESRERIKPLQQPGANAALRRITPPKYRPRTGHEMPKSEWREHRELMAHNQARTRDRVR
jgi:hypothetical protein